MFFQRQLLSFPSIPALLGLLFVGFAGIVLADLVSDFIHGGRRWQQGDWLINSLPEPVRRGTLGTLIILASEMLGVSPLATVVALQIVVVLALALVLFLLAMATVTHPVQIAVFLLPPFYPVMMVSRVDGMIYKDILALLALAILALAVVRPELRRKLVPTGLVLYVVACFSHEALVFFLPVALWLTVQSTGWNAGGKLAAGFLTVGTGAAFVFALVYSRANPEAICLELVSRGLGEHLCAGPVGWLNASLDHAVRFTFGASVGLHLVQFTLVWAVSVLVLAYLWGLPIRRGLALGVLTLIPFLPLFPIALDFGRWFAFGFFSLFMVVLASVRAQQPPPGIVPPALALAMVLGSAAVTYDSTAGVYLSGVLNRALALLG